MLQLTDTQGLILSAAAQRADNLAMPLPKGLHGVAAKTAVSRMITNGWLEEIDADSRRGEPLWRETGEGYGTTLIATEAGLLAIGLAPAMACAAASPRNANLAPAPNPDGAETLKPVIIRAGTKQAQIIAMLQRSKGASIAEIVAATSWQGHTARGMISGALKKRLGLAVTADKEDGRGVVYRIR